MDAEREIEFVVRKVSGQMAFILETHVRRDRSENKELLFSIHVHTSAQLLSDHVQTFEELRCSGCTIRERVQLLCWTYCKAETTERAEESFAASIQRYSGTDSRKV